MRLQPLLATLVATAPVARAATVTLQNDLPDGLVLDEGSTFVVKWTWNGDATGIGMLNMTTFNASDVTNSQSAILEDKLNLTKGNYSWTVKPPDNRNSLDWSSKMVITYNAGANTVQGRPFKIRSPSASSSSSGLPTPTPPPQPSPKPPAKPGAPGTGGGKGLSGGAIAGIVLGALVGVGVIATVVGLYVFRYRRKAQQTNTKTTTAGPGLEESGAGGGVGGISGVGGGDSGKSSTAQLYQKPELDAGTETAFYELDAGIGAGQGQGAGAAPAHATELDSTNPRVELAGDQGVESGNSTAGGGGGAVVGGGEARKGDSAR
ncbi:hypothetical protein F4777DRAFT_41501 [Nemania sp. FL0916]|nr:hypothetical protein F4777DRAFT_41501 [Nemania sp. FL0916]